jgi:hypothetical protein
MAGREIKFRAWNGQAMEYGGFAIHATGKIVDMCPMFDGDEDSPVMQFTGLLDSKGVEIYEGDILKNTHPRWRKSGIPPFVMEWDSDRNGWCDYSPKQDFEVIGNIHQNLELVESIGTN